MLDSSALLAKITSLKHEILKDSITPIRLGVILEELLRLVHVAYRGNLPEDIEKVTDDANDALNRALTLIEILQEAINLHMEAIRVTVVDCGPYDRNARYLFETLNPDTGRVETHDAWLAGCRYRCLVSGTSQVPGWNASDWAFIEGNPEFRVDFEPTDYLFDPDRFEVDLVIVATMYNQDITDDILDRDVVWTRYSEDNAGNPRVASDSIWAVKRAGAGKRLHLTRDDCDFTGFGPDKLTFIATVTLRDTPGTPELTAQASFEY